MKIQTTAQIESLAIDGEARPLTDSEVITLEFSAIDTGGRFRDPMLDFTFTLPMESDKNMGDVRDHRLDLSLGDPAKENNKISFSCYCEVAAAANELEINGRLREDMLSEELVGFVLKRFQ